MPKQIKIQSFATAATADELANPAFPVCLESWRPLAGAITVVIPANVEPPDIKKVRFVKSSDTSLRLADVIKYGIDTRNGYAQDMMVLDPLCYVREEILYGYDIAVKRHMGQAWMATGQCVMLDSIESEGGEWGTDALRYFWATQTIWGHISKALELQPNTPFQSPTWGGYIGNWAVTGRPMMDRARYHNVTDLRAVACLAKPAKAVEGYGNIVTAPPATNHAARLFAKPAAA